MDIRTRHRNAIEERWYAYMDEHGPEDVAWYTMEQVRERLDDIGAVDVIVGDDIRLEDVRLMCRLFLDWYG